MRRVRATLPLAEPACGAYQFYAFPLAIIGLEGASTDWLLSNFIQLAYDPDGWEADVPFCFSSYDPVECPWIDVTRLDRDWLDAMCVDPPDLVRTSIDLGRYVCLDLDCFHLEFSPLHGRGHASHDVLIHGYDDDAASYDVFTYGTDGFLRSRSVPIDDVVAAYRSAHSYRPATRRVHLYELRREASFPLDVGHVRMLLHEYVTARNSSERFAGLRTPWTRIWGIATYEVLREYLADCAAGRRELDLRHLEVLREHKTLMTRRVARVAEVTGADLSEEHAAAEQIEIMATSVRNSALLARLKGEPRRLAGVLAVVDEIESAERELIEALLASPALTGLASAPRTPEPPSSGGASPAGVERF